MGETPDIKELREAGLYEPDAPGADERLALLRFNTELGVSIDEMIAAPEEGFADTRWAPRHLGSERKLSLRELAERSSEPTELLVTIWRAASFAEPGPDEAIFTESSLEPLELFKSVSQIYGEDVTLQ